MRLFTHIEDVKLLVELFYIKWRLVLPHMKRCSKCYFGSSIRKVNKGHKIQ